MSNTLAGTNLAAVAQRTLDTLLRRFPMASSFSTDFSADVASVGESVTTRVASQPTVQDFYSTTAAADVTTTARTISLSNYSGVRIGFSDMEWSKSSINLFDIFVNPVANTVIKAIMDDVLARVTLANFGAAGLVSTAANFDADDVVDLATALDTANVPFDPRSLVISPAYYGALAKDNAIQAAFAYGNAGAIQDNRFPRVHGFDVLTYNGIPGNAQNLVGFAGGPQALLIAARVPALPGNFPGEIEAATDPESGLTIQVRKWYSADDRKHYMEAGVIHGSQIGVVGNLTRITSA
jgi:hypothetical protein